MSDNHGMIEQAPAEAAVEHERFAPRIVVEAFCVSAEFAAAIQSASVDRRMTKAKTNVEMGGAGIAAKRFANLCSPNLVIVETDQTGPAVFAELEPLAEVCDPDTRVIVAGPSNDVTLYRELIRQGVSEYLVTPVSPMQIIEAITTIYSSPESSPAARTISVFGVKGGVGASTIAHNLAAELADATKKDTILTDMDLEFGSVALNFNIDSRHSLAEALSDLEGLDDVKLSRLLFQQNDHLKLLPSPASLQCKAELDEHATLNFLDCTRYACDTLVLDLPHRWTDGARAALRQSDEVVLVATPDLICLRNLKSVFDWVKAQRLHDTPPRVVLNQVGQPKRPEIPVRDFVEIVGAEVDLVLPYDAAAFGAAMNKGQMLSEVGSGGKVAELIEQFSIELLGREAGAARADRRRSGLSVSGLLASITGR